MELPMEFISPCIDWSPGTHFSATNSRQGVCARCDADVLFRIGGTPPGRSGPLNDGRRAQRRCADAHWEPLSTRTIAVQSVRSAQTRRGAVTPENILKLIEQLAGQERPLPRDVPAEAARLLNGVGLGYSQFNELLLTLGYDRVTHAFFQYLVDGETTYVSGTAFRKPDDFVQGVD